MAILGNFCENADSCESCAVSTYIIDVIYLKI